MAVQLALPGIGEAPAPGRADGPGLGAQRGVEYRELAVRGVLHLAAGRHLSGTWSVNPYRGCEFGCTYCYARYTHEFLDLAPDAAWDRLVLVKTNAARALARDLRTRELGPRGLVVGSATDPWQPAERRFGITRALLEALLPYRGLSLALVTRSGLVARDAELLARLAERHEVTVSFSCLSARHGLLREAEPRAPEPAVRLRAMRRLSALGVRCELLVMPVLPGLTDGEDNLAEVVAAARAAGARDVHARVLWLSGATRRRFAPWLRERHPELVPLYRRLYAGGAMYAFEEYRKELARRVERVLGGPPVERRGARAGSDGCLATPAGSGAGGFAGTRALD